MNNPETLIKLGAFLRASREARGLTQTALARQAGVSRQATISRLEQGGDVTADTLISVAAALGLELVFAPIGQSSAVAAAAAVPPRDLLDEFDDLRDDLPDAAP